MLLRHLSAARNRQLGLRTLSGLLARSEKNIALQVESVLPRLGYLTIVPGGREITPAGLRYLKSLSS